MQEVEPENALQSVLAEARAIAFLHQHAQLARIAQFLGSPVEEVSRRLEIVVDRLEIRVTRGLAISRSLFAEMEAGRVPTIRSIFETGRQDHTEHPEQIAAAIAFRLEREGKAFGPEVAALQEEDRAKYGFAYFEGTPTEPLPFGPVCFVLNLNSSDLRARITFTPVDSSIDNLDRDEVGTLDHPLNAFARSSDALRASGLISAESPLPPGSGVRHNAEEGVPEAQIWGPLPVTPDNIEVIIVEVESRNSAILDELQAVARQQKIPLIVRVVGGEA